MRSIIIILLTFIGHVVSAQEPQVLESLQKDTQNEVKMLLCEDVEISIFDEDYYGKDEVSEILVKFRDDNDMKSMTHKHGDTDSFVVSEWIGKEKYKVQIYFAEEKGKKLIEELRISQ